MQKSILSTRSGTDAGGRTGVAARIAGRTAAARAPGYEEEVRRLIDAGREVMARNGTTARARVADVVEVAGLSNDAFYRHFASKDALVTAILEDGTERLASYLAHQMGKESTPDARVRRWVQGVLAQADRASASTTLAVLWNAGGLSAGGRSPAATLGALLIEPLAELGSTDAELDASLVAHAAVGRLSDLLWSDTRPGTDDVEHLATFALRAVGAGPTGSDR